MQMQVGKFGLVEHGYLGGKFGYENIAKKSGQKPYRKFHWQKSHTVWRSWSGTEVSGKTWCNESYGSAWKLGFHVFFFFEIFEK
jgi:hypothetical protein